MSQDHSTNQSIQPQRDHLMRGITDTDHSIVKNHEQTKKKPIIMLKNHLIFGGEEYSFSNGFSSGVNTEAMKKEDDSVVFVAEK